MPIIGLDIFGILSEQHLILIYHRASKGTHRQRNNNFFTILLTNSFQFEFVVHRSIEIGNSMDSLHMISILNDIEDINETQEFKIRDSKYLVDRELFDNLAGTNNDPLGSSSGDKYECNIPHDTHNRMTTHNTSSNSVPDLLSCDHRYLRVKFARTADFYGRITIYNLEIFGSEKDPLK